MEIGESVSVAAFSDVEKAPCPFEPHRQKGFIARKQKGDKSVAELISAMENGRSTRRWKQLENEFVEAAKNEEQGGTSYARPDPEGQIKIAEIEYPLSVAAHHLIPGKDSLPRSTLARFLWASEGLIDSDVGYDVDGAENGVWMPTHQSMSAALGKKQKIIIHDEEDPTRTSGMSWAELSERAREREESPVSYSALFLPRYTQQAMRIIGVQFHDSHSDYSTRVTNLLNNIDTVLEIKVGMCDKCKKSDKKSPPYMIVFRLNTISNLLRGILSGSPKRAWLMYYTSEFSVMYLRAPISVERLS